MQQPSLHPSIHLYFIVLAPSSRDTFFEYSPLSTAQPIHHKIRSCVGGTSVPMGLFCTLVGGNEKHKIG